MIPYYMLSRDYNQLARNINRFSQDNTQLNGNASINCSPVSVSEMISSGTLHAVNAVEKGWSQMASLFGR
jgi:hypothetical protein